MPHIQPKLSFISAFYPRLILWYQSRMASNLCSTTNEDRLLALEVDTHTINCQLEKTNEEIATVKNGLEALTNVVAQIGNDLKAIGGRGKESGSVRLE